MSLHHLSDRERGEMSGVAQVNFNIPGSLSLHVTIISSLSPPPSIYFICELPRISKRGMEGEELLIPSCVYIKQREVWCGTQTGERKFTHHKECSFLFTAAKMNSFLLLLSASTSRQERMESVWRADTMSQSEAMVSVREREGRLRFGRLRWQLSPAVWQSFVSDTEFHRCCRSRVSPMLPPQ